jgi:hypothetical protein
MIYQAPMTNIPINMYSILFHIFCRFSAFSGLVNIWKVWNIIIINTIRDVNHIIRLITVYNIGILLSANNHDHISHIFWALSFNTSLCFQYIASTICLDHIIINIDIALRAIIVVACFCDDQSDLLINENTLPDNTRNKTPNTR